MAMSLCSSKPSVRLDAVPPPPRAELIFLLPQTSSEPPLCSFPSSGSSSR